VLLAALQWAGEQQDERVAQIAVETSNHVERLRRYLDITVPREGVLRDEYILWLEAWVALRHRPELLEECVSMSKHSYDSLKGLIEDGVRAGAFAPVASCQTITQRIVAIRDGLGYRCVIGYRGMDGTSIHRIMCEFVADALALSASELLGEGT
jgi:hypothetical protein